MKQMIAPLLAIGCAALSALPAAAQDAERGDAYYLQHCATCHGLDATGNGPMAGVLLVPPSDLTRLAARNDGVFPTVRVVMRIDGRDPLVSHGSPMPVYGQFFQQGADVAIKAPSGQPILTSEPIVDLLTYLQTLQDEQ
jgi:mono/diheme cytochrome c family protein